MINTIQSQTRILGIPQNSLVRLVGHPWRPQWLLCLL